MFKTANLLPVLLASSGGKRSEPGHEKVQSGEGDHVNGQFSEVSVELTGEPKQREKNKLSCENDQDSVWTWE